MMADDQDTELGSLQFMPKLNRYLREEGKFALIVCKLSSNFNLLQFKPYCFLKFHYFPTTYLPRFN